MAQHLILGQNLVHGGHRAWRVSLTSHPEGFVSGDHALFVARSLALVGGAVSECE